MGLRSAAEDPRSAPRRRPSRSLLALLSLALGSLVALTAPAVAQDATVGDTVTASYAAWQAGEHAQARDLARQAIALDDGVASIVARRVLVLALQELDEPALALAELEQYMSFELVPRDRQWATDLDAALRAALPAVEPEPPPEPDPVLPDPVVPEPTAAPDAVEEPEPARSTAPAVLLSAGGGFQQLGRWSYGAVTAEISWRMVGPLRLALGYQLGLVGGQPCSSTEPDGCLSALSSLSIGPQLRGPGPVSPLVSAEFLTGFNGGLSPYGDAMFGVQAGGGIELAPGPVGVRLRGLFRLLSRPVGGVVGPFPGALVAVDLVVRAGR